jgi:O-antigen/teichoic acid export membrane protein
MAFRKIAFSTAIMSSVTIFRMLAQLLVVPFLSRLLSPGDYGLVAMAMPFVLFTMMFTDVGMGQSLLRSGSGKKELWSTCFWVTVILGTAFSLLIVLAAPLVSFFFKEPHLEPLLKALALIMLPQAASTIPEAYLRHNHKFGIIAGTEAAAMAGGLLAASFVAYEGGGAWALIAQQLVLYGMRFVLTFWFAKFWPLLVFDLLNIREHLIFGRNVLGASFMGAVTQSLDNLIIGRTLGSHLLGFYSMAFLFVRLPLRIITGPLEYVIYAHLAPLGDNKPVIRQMFLLLTRIQAILLFPVIGLIAAAHEPIFKLLLSDKWLQAGTLYMIAAPAAALQTLTAFSGAFMMSLGRTDIQLRMNTEFCVLLATGLLLFSKLGIACAVATYTAAVFLYFPRFITMMLPRLECARLDYLRVIVIPIFVTVGCIAIYTTMSKALILSDWEQVLLSAGVALFGIAVSALSQYRSLFDEIATFDEAEAIVSA